MNLVISTCGAIGVGYVVYKQSIRPGFSEMGSRGDGQISPGRWQPPTEAKSIRTNSIMERRIEN